MYGEASPANDFTKLRYLTSQSSSPVSTLAGTRVRVLCTTNPTLFTVNRPTMKYLPRIPLSRKHRPAMTLGNGLQSNHSLIPSTQRRAVHALLAFLSSPPSHILLPSKPLQSPCAPPPASSQQRYRYSSIKPSISTIFLGPCDAIS